MRLLLPFLLAALASAQVSPAIRITGATTNPSFLQITTAASGLVTFEALVFGPGIAASRGPDGKLLVVDTIPIPPPVKLPTQAAWITLVVSPSNPLTWCVSTTPSSTATYYPTLLHEIHTLRPVPANSAVYTVDVMSDVQPGPTPDFFNPGLTVSVPPIWSPASNSCGGNAGVTYQANSLSLGESRISVEARVAF